MREEPLGKRPEKVQLSDIEIEEHLKRRKHHLNAYWHPVQSITEGHDNHGLNDYLNDLDLTEADLANKTIVDIGIGRQNKFAKEVREKGIKAIIIGVSPDLENDTTRKIIDQADPARVKPNFEKDKDTVPENLLIAAVGQMLPLQDESADLILALYSLSYYNMDVGSPEQASAWIEEVGRVLKKGGEARIAPPYPWTTRLPLKKLAEKYGLQYELVPEKYHRFWKEA
jgi:SAM-dependent methyltransferase